jgi:hypothetical protein
MLSDSTHKHNVMKNHLKESYDRRITPRVKIFMLVVILFLGLHLAYTEGNRADKKHAETTVVE